METSELIKNLDRISTSCAKNWESSLNDWFEKLRIMLNVTHSDFNIFEPKSMHRINKHSVSNYPLQWQKEYEDNDYQKCDPFTLHCFESTVPIIWENIEQSSQFKDAVFKRYIYRLRTQNINNGLSVVIRGKGNKLCIINVNWTDEKSYDEITQMILVCQALLPHIYESCKQFFLSNELNINLTKREKECMNWACDGKTSQEISQILDVSERTIIFHLANLIRKTGSSNRQQAIAKTIIHGLIEPVL